ncbi:MAG: lecithin retinol acyltransferase family protein, partial [Acidaminococcaceae bacterium]|nr:lecithin retinol acyltransferase family protein [Acidaminococcaceae bacterium]
MTFSVSKTKQVKKVRGSVNVLPTAPLPGDVIYVKRMGDLYRHYGIYAGNNRVIHYAGHGGD